MSRGFVRPTSACIRPRAAAASTTTTTEPGRASYRVYRGGAAAPILVAGQTVHHHRPSLLLLPTQAPRCRRLSSSLPPHHRRRAAMPPPPVDGRQRSSPLRQLLRMLRRCLQSLQKYSPFGKGSAADLAAASGAGAPAPAPAPTKDATADSATTTTTSSSTAVGSTTAVERRAVVRARIPAGAWDSHMHVFDAARFPLLPSAPYAPHDCATPDALAFEATMGLANIVLVQPSAYGNDNSCMLDAMRQLGPARARGVIGIDPETTTPEQLKAWHAAGVRGVRINLQSVGKTISDRAVLRAELLRYADVVRPLGWVVQVYVPLAMVTLLEDIVPDLDVRVCIDHIGHPPLASAAAAATYRSTGNPYDLDGFASLIALLKAGSTFVKLSGAYRFTQSPALDYADVQPLVAEILKVAGRDRAVFATDWPHTRYEGLDITSWAERVLAWCGDDEAMVQAVFRDTAVDLWGVDEE